MDKESEWSLFRRKLADALLYISYYIYWLKSKTYGYVIIKCKKKKGH